MNASKHNTQSQHNEVTLYPVKQIIQDTKLKGILRGRGENSHTEGIEFESKQNKRVRWLKSNMNQWPLLAPPFSHALSHHY